MRYNSGARLDTSEVLDVRRGGGKGLALGGGGLGVIGVVVYLLINVLGGGGSGMNAVTDILGQLGQQGGAATADNSQIEKQCRTGADANTSLECAVVADINSIQEYWSATLAASGARYTQAPTVWFSGQVNTGCGAASSGAGPFYCPADKRVYIDLTFYDELKKTFGATGGPFVNAYVLAHEYGHHVQNLLGTAKQVQPGSRGASSGSVRLELQADCYAGVWARHASTVPGPDGVVLIEEITDTDIANALDAAARIGDDYIQTNLGGGRVDQGSFTHGTSTQRQKWFTTGYRSGQPNVCDTFGTNQLG